MPTAPETTWNKGRVVGKKPPLTPDQVGGLMPDGAE